VQDTTVDGVSQGCGGVNNLSAEFERWKPLTCWQFCKYFCGIVKAYTDFNTVAIIILGLMISTTLVVEGAAPLH
jgi:hypothetical protein